MQRFYDKKREFEETIKPTKENLKRLKQDEAKEELRLREDAKFSSVYLDEKETVEKANKILKIIGA